MAKKAPFGLKYIQSFKDNRGKLRCYYRHPGSPRIALPDPSDPVAFIRAYEAACSGKLVIGGREGAPDTLQGVIVLFKKSAEYAALAPNSKKLYDRCMEHIRASYLAGMRIDEIRRRNVIELRDEIGEETPGLANVVISVLSRIMSFAMDNDLRESNPCARVKKFKGGEYRAWTYEECVKFEFKWARGTLPRLMYELLVNTAQRRGDIATLKWSDIKDRIALKQQKTGVDVSIPVHSSLRQELLLTRKRAVQVIVGSKGNPLTPDAFGSYFADAIEAAGLPEECVAHGLRKTALKRLAEAGCTPHEIMAISGHKSYEQVAHYTKEAEQKRLSDNAMSKLEKHIP